MSAKILDKELTNMDRLGPTKKQQFLEEKNKQLAYKLKEKEDRYQENLDRVLRCKEERMRDQDHKNIEKERLAQQRLNEIERER